MPSVRTSLSAHPYSGPTAGLNRCHPHPLLTQQLLSDSGSSDSGHRTLALNGLYSCQKYVQGENTYFWWENCGKHGVLVDGIGKRRLELLSLQRCGQKQDDESTRLHDYQCRNSAFTRVKAKSQKLVKCFFIFAQRKWERECSHDSAPILDRFTRDDNRRAIP